MKYKIGSKVRLVHTGDIAVVESDMGNGYYNVLLLRDNYLIPVTESDIALVSYVEKTIPFKEIKVESFERIDITIFSVTNSGFFLIFVPEYDVNHDILHYKVGVFNDLNKKVTFNLNITTKESFQSSFSDLVLSYHVLLVGNLPDDIFNMGAQFIFTLWENTTEGNINCLSKVLKIKPKFLIKNSKKLHEFKSNIFLFEIIKSFDIRSVNKSTGVDLETYTKSQLKSKKEKKSNFYNFDPYNVWDYAEFPREIDLHIEKLEPQYYTKIDPSEIMNIQLSAFDRYLEKAIVIGVDRVFIIHGIGESKLKKSIALKLAAETGVVSFKNEYHPRYAYGATEVNLK